MTCEDIDNIISSLLRGEKYYIDDYFGGELLTFGYDKPTAQYYIQRIDTIVGSYNRITYHSASEVFQILNTY